MKDIIHVQSREAREKITDIFCRLICISALLSVVFYAILKMYDLVAASSFIALLFIFFIYLNKKKSYGISREAIIITTNLGVIFFSLYLGFGSGIYLYLFVAPLLIYLLVDFSDLMRIVLYLLFYLSSFVLIYSFKKFNLQLLEAIPKEFTEYIYFFNFCSAFALCFGLIFYFAHNNSRYIDTLNKHKELLGEEVALRTESEELLKKSITEREVLLSEIHHRVKNNLSIISAFINMQMVHLTDSKDKEIFEDTRERIFTMALIHNMLYQNGSLSKIDFKEYIGRFCQHLVNTLSHDTEIKIKEEIEEVDINIDTAIPLAMIMNELVSNAFKHAFPGKEKGSIVVSLKILESNRLQFCVKDNGCGAPEKVLDASSTGMTIVTSLVEQIEGELFYKNQRGSCFTVIFSYLPS